MGNSSQAIGARLLAHETGQRLLIGIAGLSLVTLTSLARTLLPGSL